MFSRNTLLVAAVSALLTLSACGGSGGKGPHNDNDGGNIEENEKNKNDDNTNGLEGAAIPDNIRNDSRFLELYPPGDNHWDRDTIQNLSDNCPIVDNPNQKPANTELPHLKKYGAACVLDTNGDGFADAVDFDGDGVADEKDNCPWAYNPLQTDTDGDGMGDACDPDLDGDGIPNQKDNCPFVSNTDQTPSTTEELKAYGQRCVMDTNDDGGDDAIDLDGDRVPDTYTDNSSSGGLPVDNCPYVANNPDGTRKPLKDIKQADGDEDGIGDACDIEPKTPAKDSEEDQKESERSGQKVCRFGINENDQCMTREQYDAKRQAEQDDEFRKQGVGSSCPFGEGAEYKNARVLLGGEEFYSVKWDVPFGELFPSLENPYLAVDGNASTHASFNLPLQVAKNLLEVGRAAWNIIVSPFKLVGVDLSFGGRAASVQIFKKDGSRFDDTFSRATVFLSSPASLANIGFGGGNVTLIDVDSNGKVVPASNTSSSTPLSVSVLTLTGGENMYAVEVSATLESFNGVSITPNANLISKTVNIHGICIE